MLTGHWPGNITRELKMKHENLKIISLKDALKLNLSIPNYQRPYRWSTESVSTLFNDIYSAYKMNIPEYRSGSIVLHNNNQELEIVDGQQRITTLSILTYCFYKVLKSEEYKEYSNLLNRKETFNTLSSKSIVENYEILKRHCKIIGSELKAFINYTLENCTVVEIVTNSEQEAFQFFDSQNSRGKALAPQDLLKSYHLREMYDSSEAEKIKIITSWENEKQKELSLFFEYTLYPLIQWYKNKSGLYYSSKKINAFKGIKQNNKYHFSIYHKAANLYIEHFNSEGMYELTSGKKVNQFQLTQPLIAGKRFFLYTLYYFNLYKQVIKILESKIESNFIPTYGSGNCYVRNLFINIVVFFIDKFNMEELTESRLDFLYKWAYSLRVIMHSVYLETIDKYARGNHDRINKELNLFAKISEMQNPQELDSIILERVNEEQLESYKSIKYKNIWNKIFGEIE